MMPILRCFSPHFVKFYVKPESKSVFAHSARHGLPTLSHVAKAGADDRWPEVEEFWEGEGSVSAGQGQLAIQPHVSDAVPCRVHPPLPTVSRDV